MKIKNILAVLSLGMVSCVGLEQYPTTSYTDETFWTIEDNVGPVPGVQPVLAPRLLFRQ